MTTIDHLLYFKVPGGQPLVVPPGNPVHQVHGASGAPLSTPLFGGGGFDSYGSERIPRGARTVSLQARILGTETERQEQLNAWYAVGNMRGRLFRHNALDVVVWQWARLIPPAPETRWDTPGFTQIDLVWLIYGDTWNGLRHGNGLDLDADPPEGFDEGLVFDYAGSQWDTEFDLPDHATIDTTVLTPPLNMGGNVPQSIGVITLTAGNADLVGTDSDPITLYLNGVIAWRWEGTIVAGDSLVVDTGAVSVLNDGAWAYELFTEPDTRMEWMVLEPGDNTASIAYAGGGTGALIHFDYYDSFA